MWRFSILILFSLVSGFCYGQQVQQLTKNSFFDFEPDICNGRIAWVGGYLKDPNTLNFLYVPWQIYLAENGEIRKLTSGNYQNHSVRVGDKYVVWNRSPIGKPGLIDELMYYDGNSIRQIPTSTTNNSMTLTAGNNIIWEGKDTDGNCKLNWFNGEESVLITNAYYKMLRRSYDATGIGEISKEAFVYLHPTKGLIYFDFNEQTQKPIAKIYNQDSTIGNQVWISGRSVLYSRWHYPSGYYKKFYYIYKNGHSTALPDSLKIILHFDSTFIAWNDFLPSTDPSFKNLYIWRDGKNYLISQYPFTTLNTYSELADIKFAFEVSKQFEFSELYYFNGKEIINLSIPNRQNYRYIYSNRSVVWDASKVLPMGLADDAEIYYYCNTQKDSCYQYEPLDDEPLVIVKDYSNIYFDQSQQNINIDITTTLEKEQFEVALYDLRGRLILSENLNFSYGKNQYSIPALNLQQSIYILRLNNLISSDKSTTKKLLITH